MHDLPKTSFEISQPGHKAYSLPKSDPAFEMFYPPEEYARKGSLELPELTELEIMRHFNALLKRNVGIDDTFYPLGSCTMKYNPRINEVCAQLAPFQNSHPLAPDEDVQGNLWIISGLIKKLCMLTGMRAGTLVPNAGAQGEFTALRMMQAYHLEKNEQRTEMLIPNHAHGTNPASAAMAGYKVVTVNIDQKGDIDREHLKSLLSEKTAGLMLTNPSTIGLFSENIQEISALVHQAGGLMYYDGANFNAIVGLALPAKMGFDLLHLNLHKTFSTPHGGGGPGSGPVFCTQELAHLLPNPKVVEGKVIWEDSKGIGKVATFHGNFLIYLRAYVYITLLGVFGLRKVAENAVLNANYLKKKLESVFTIPYPQFCMHEFVVQADKLLDRGVRALDIAKRLLDYGVYAPTIYFPLIIQECMLIEPTETESMETLDLFCEILKKIVNESAELLKTAPHTTPVGRLNEVLAARKPILSV